MMRWVHFRVILFCLVLLVSAVSGQLDQTQKDIEKSGEEVQKAAEKARGFTEADYWENIGLQWKEFLLRNKFVSSVNVFFTKINIVFLILFGMNWSLSFNMFFAFLFWVFTLYSIIKYMSSVDKKAIGILYSFIIVILLAQINLFEYVGKWSVALVFYKSSLLWKVGFFLGVMVLFVFFGVLNKFFSNLLKKRKEGKEKNADKEDRKTFGQWVYALTGRDWRKRK
ncbi:MAG: hypothetical protein AABX10_02100 [Nanoarchaeota archaeon]